jgi:hypothetical protein
MQWKLYLCSFVAQRLWSLLQSHAYFIFFSSFKDTFYNNLINSQNVFLSIISFFIFYVFLIAPINIAILCPTIAIILFFIFKLLLFLFLNRYCLELLLYWTIIVFVFESLLFETVTVLNCYYFKSLLFWTITVLNCYCFKSLLFWTITVLNYYYIELLLLLFLNRYCL